MIKCQNSLQNETYNGNRFGKKNGTQVMKSLVDFPTYTFFWDCNVRMHEAIIREIMAALTAYYYVELMQESLFSGVETGSLWLHLYLNILVAGREWISFPWWLINSATKNVLWTNWNPVGRRAKQKLWDVNLNSSQASFAAIRTSCFLSQAFSPPSHPHNENRSPRSLSYLQVPSPR